MADGDLGFRYGRRVPTSRIPDRATISRLHREYSAGQPAYWAAPALDFDPAAALSLTRVSIGRDGEAPFVSILIAPTGASDGTGAIDLEIPCDALLVCSGCVLSARSPIPGPPTGLDLLTDTGAAPADPRLLEMLVSEWAAWHRVLMLDRPRPYPVWSGEGLTLGLERAMLAAYGIEMPLRPAPTGTPVPQGLNRPWTSTQMILHNNPCRSLLHHVDDVIAAREAGQDGFIPFS